MSLAGSYGLHVHVDASALGLSGQRRLVSLYVTVDNVLVSLPRPSRWESTFCNLVYGKSRLAVDEDAALEQGNGGLDKEEGPDDVYSSKIPAKMRLMLEAIHNCDTQQIRRGILSPMDFRNALNMKAVQGDKYTFEFRHFQGSLDLAVIRQWTRVCLALVTAARGLGDYRQHPASEVYEVFHQISRRPGGQAWESLLEFLGLPDAVAF